MKSRPSFVVAVVAASLLVACSGGSAGRAAATTPTRSSHLTIAAVPMGGAVTATAITLPSGSLDLETALISLDRVAIDAHTSGSSEQEGEQGGPDDGGGHRGGAGEPHGSDQDHIVLSGPFTVDIASGGAVLGSASVYPGTFTSADLFFLLSTAAPLSGDSIYVRGTYHPATGADVPVTLASKFDGRVDVALANGGIVVTANTVVPIELSFDLAALFGSLDLASATVEGGEILIDDTHNIALSTAFEANLGGSVGCSHEGENGNEARR